MLKINENNEIEIYNVIPIFRGERVIKFITNISIEQLQQVYKKLVYDEDTQRGYKGVKNKKGEVISQKPIMNKKNIMEIKEKIKIHDFFDGGHLIWNVRINDVSHRKNYYEYIPDENKLLLKPEIITLPDSAQRHKALNELINIVDLDISTFNLPLDVCFYTKYEEQTLFSEINGCGQKATKTRSLYLSNNDKAYLLKEIIVNSELNGRIDTKSSNISRTKYVATFATLYDSLFHQSYGAYKILLEEEKKEVKDWLIRFYNELIKVRPEFADDTVEGKLETRKNSIILSSPMFFAFANVAKTLQKDRNWIRKLNRLNNKYRYGLWEGDLFSINNPLWHGTVCSMNKKEEWKVISSNRTKPLVCDILLKYLNL